MVCSSYVAICFPVEHHHMPDRVLHLAWRTKDYKNWSQDHGLTWAVCCAHIRRGFEGKVGMYMGIDLWSLPSVNTTLCFHAYFETSDKWLNAMCHKSLHKPQKSVPSQTSIS